MTIVGPKMPQIPWSLLPFWPCEHRTLRGILNSQRWTVSNSIPTKIKPKQITRPAAKPQLPHLSGYFGHSLQWLAALLPLPRVLVSTRCRSVAAAAAPGQRSGVLWASACAQVAAPVAAPVVAGGAVRWGLRPGWRGALWYLGQILPVTTIQPSKYHYHISIPRFRSHSKSERWQITGNDVMSLPLGDFSLACWESIWVWIKTRQPPLWMCFGCFNKRLYDILVNDKIIINHFNKPIKSYKYHI